ncbi:hypothetical protein LJC33_02555 [Eubacteriales bacterium OttesenSCG-928-N13]|nr:hypothetical protein [Eubacteriales bacterium OttesenSCG-928-N13]
MITCTLAGKKYSVDFVTGRALREMQPALDMYAKITKASLAALNGEAAPEETPIADALDVMARWFTMLFGNQFSIDELYDNYPADRLLHDIVLALLAVQGQTTEVLSEFPTTAAPEPTIKTDI